MSLNWLLRVITISVPDSRNVLILGNVLSAICKEWHRILYCWNSFQSITFGLGDKVVNVLREYQLWAHKNYQTRHRISVVLYRFRGIRFLRVHSASWSVHCWIGRWPFLPLMARTNFMSSVNICTSQFRTVMSFIKIRKRDVPSWNLKELLMSLQSSRRLSHSKSPLIGRMRSTGEVRDREKT